MEARFPEAFAETASHQFRRETDHAIAASLHHNFGCLTGRAVPGRIRYGYADIASLDTPALLQRWLRVRAWDVLYLNDHDSSQVDPETQCALMSEFLNSDFPLPSAFESS